MSVRVAPEPTSPPAAGVHGGGRGVLGWLRRVGALLLAQPRAWAWLAPAAWAALIWVLSSRPTDPPPRPELWRSFVWNLAHGPVFGVLALLLLPLAPRRGGWAVLGPAQLAAVAVAAGAWAVVDELHQGWVPGRAASATDLVTDLAGIVAVLVVARYVSRPSATAPGLRARLACGVLACALGALLATFEPALIPSVQP